MNRSALHFFGLKFNPFEPGVPVVIDRRDARESGGKRVTSPKLSAFARIQLPSTRPARRRPVVGAPCTLAG